MLRRLLPWDSAPVFRFFAWYFAFFWEQVGRGFPVAGMSLSWDAAPFGDLLSGGGLMSLDCSSLVACNFERDACSHSVLMTDFAAASICVLYLTLR